MRRTLAALFLALLCGCAARKSAPVSVTVALRGDDATVALAKEGLQAPAKGAPIEPRLAELPVVAPSTKSASPVEARVARARTLYVNADFPGCLKELAGDTLVRDLLGEGERALVTRLLLWRTACHAGLGAEKDAAASARALAVLGLELPAEVAGVTPQVESLLVRVQQEVAAAPRVALRVRCDHPGAAIFLDGREAGASPCTLSVPRGEHVLRAESDGIVPAVQVATVEATPLDVAIATVAASPALAAQQWSKRFGGGTDIDSDASMRLLQIAMRAERFILLNATLEKDTARLRGVFAADGEVRSRAELAKIPLSRVPRDTELVVRDLLVRGKIVEHRPLWKRWTFWASMGAGVAAATAGTAALLYEPPTQTSLEF